MLSKPKYSIKSRILSKICMDPNIYAYFLGICGTLLGIGFLIADTSTPGYVNTRYVGGYLIWGLGFLVYGITKITQTIVRIPKTVKLVNAILGLWGWSFIVLSVLVFNNGNPILPGQIVLIYPLALEIINVTLDILILRSKYTRRGTDI